MSISFVSPLFPHPPSSPLSPHPSPFPFYPLALLTCLSSRASLPAGVFREAFAQMLQGERGSGRRFGTEIACQFMGINVQCPCMCGMYRLRLFYILHMNGNRECHLRPNAFEGKYFSKYFELHSKALFFLNIFSNGSCLFCVLCKAYFSLIYFLQISAAITFRGFLNATDNELRQLISEVNKGFSTNRDRIHELLLKDWLPKSRACVCSWVGRGSATLAKMGALMLMI